MRNEIEKFSELMSKRLEDNKHKDDMGWSHFDPFQLLDRIHENMKNVSIGVKNENEELVIRSAVDIANYAMMIADNLNED